MAERGLDYQAFCRDPELYEVFFFRAEDRPAQAAEVRIDVRGLEPPEPMERTLAALESLPAGASLVVTHHRNPLLLLPTLDERGFEHESRELAGDLWEIRIRKRS
jgi:tRNA 2-thiouridine synthesizing protein A